jgi:hypothetical protein
MINLWENKIEYKQLSFEKFENIDDAEDDKTGASLVVHSGHLHSAIEKHVLK